MCQLNLKAITNPSMCKKGTHTMTTDETPAMSTDETHTAAAETTKTPDVPSVDTAQGDGHPPRGRGRVAFLGLAAVAIALGVVIYAGIRTRTAAEANLKRATAQAAIPTVDVVAPKAGAPTLELVLPGDMQPFTYAPIYARTSGYVKRWYFDIGARVKQGQLLAEIETPELDQQFM